jgi:hypothetical protein
MGPHDTVSANPSGMPQLVFGNSGPLVDQIRKSFD